MMTMIIQLKLVYQNAPAPRKMSHHIKEKCDIIRRSRWHYRCGTQIAPEEYVTTSISRHSESRQTQVEEGKFVEPCYINSTLKKVKT